MIFLGVDPGLFGAVALVDANGYLVTVADTPTIPIGKKCEYDRRTVKAWLTSWNRESTDPVIACVELVHAMPGQGVVSMWRMGQGFELWCMAFTILNIPWETVTPQRWKSVMLDGMPKDKNASRFKAQALWPAHAGRFGRKKDDGRAEAALIAEYLRRQWVKR